MLIKIKIVIIKGKIVFGLNNRIEVDNIGYVIKLNKVTNIIKDLVNEESYISTDCEDGKYETKRNELKKVCILYIMEFDEKFSSSETKEENNLYLEIDGIVKTTECPIIDVNDVKEENIIGTIQERFIIYQCNSNISKIVFSEDIKVFYWHEKWCHLVDIIDPITNPTKNDHLCEIVVNNIIELILNNIYQKNKNN